MTIRFSSLADQDLFDIWAWNADHYGIGRADRYWVLMSRSIEQLGTYPLLGAEVSERAGLRKLTIKRRRQAHGHIVFYRIVDDSVEIVRVLHTARDWQSQLP